MTNYAWEMTATGIIFLVSAMIAQSPWPILIWVIWYGFPDSLKDWATSWLVWSLPKPPYSPTARSTSPEIAENQAKTSGSQSPDNQFEGIQEMTTLAQQVIDAWLQQGKPFSELSGRKIADLMRTEQSDINENAARWVAGEILKKYRTVPSLNGFHG